MNDLEQAIAYHERKVNALKSAMPCDGCPIDECSEEHRQLAEWLRELKAYKEDKHCCQYCKYREMDVDESPCDQCKHNHVDCFEVRGDGE